jgi:hypothetical protein
MDSETYFAGASDRVKFTRPQDGTLHPWTCTICGSLSWNEEQARAHAEDHKGEHEWRHKDKGKLRRLEF